MLTEMAKEASNTLNDQPSTIMKNYRTFVPYDFSIVKKAKFHVYRKIIAGDMKYKYTHEALTVQFNPDQISGFAGEPNLVPSQPDNGTALRPLVAKGDYTVNHTLSMNLHFDLYDEYNLRTGDGANGFSEFHLLNNGVSILPRLIQLCGSTEEAVLFKWGAFSYAGILTSVNPTYKAFSRWGTPLKADVDVTIAREVRTASDGSPMMEASFVAANIDDKLQDKLMTAALIASQALR